MLFIYWLEENQHFCARVSQIHERMVKRGDILCTSLFTIGEVTAGFYRRHAEDEAAQIRATFESAQIELIPFSADAVDRYARIRGTHRVSPADAIHLSSAAKSGVNLFLTNDRKLHSLVIPGIDFIAGLDVSLF